MLSWRRVCLVLALVGLLLVNGVAWMQAWSLTHFAITTQLPRRMREMSLPEVVWAAVSGVPLPRPGNRHTPRDMGLPYRIYRLSMRGGGWVEAWWTAHPQPRGVVLLFSGYATSKDILLRPAQAFYSLGYTVMMVDFRGAGGSSGDTTTLGLREGEDVSQVMAYVRTVQPGLPVVLYGFSMGSTAILRAVAAEDAQPDALVLEAPFDRFLETVRIRVRRERLPDFPAAELLVFWGGLQHGFNGFAYNPGGVCPICALSNTVAARRGG